MFISKKRLTELIRAEVLLAVNRADSVQVVTHNPTYGDQRPITYVRPNTGYDYRSDYNDEIQNTNNVELFTKILGTLKELGVEVYRDPGKKAEWGLRLKKGNKV